MINISKYFKLKLRQNELEFVDVKLDDDNELFIDPRLIEFDSNPLFKPMSICLKTYSSYLMHSIITKDRKMVNNLLSGLEEPKETRLGFAWHNSNGNSVGKILKLKFERSILNNPAISAGKVNHWSELELFIEDINCDRISDMTTKIIKSYLINFTQNQCSKLGIRQRKLFKQGELFNAKSLQWESKDVELPYETIGGIEKPIIFVPKSIIRRKNDANANLGYFYRYAVEHFVLNDGEFLKNFPRNGKNDTVLKRDIRKAIKDIKQTNARWILRYKNLLLDYRSYYNKEKLHPLSDAEIENIVYNDKFLNAA